MSRLREFVVVRTRFEGFHCWPGAPEAVRFLRSRHRHEFHVEAEKAVSHADRDVEFIQLKRAIEAYAVHPWTEFGSRSCEMIARDLLDRFKLRRCVVWEDGENGGGVERC